MVRLSVRQCRSLSKCMDPFYGAKLEEYSKYSPSPVTIKHFIEYGKTSDFKTSFLFMRREIPVRLANIMKELELLPEQLQEQRPCMMIQDFYVESFKDMISFEKEENTEATRVDFTKKLKGIRRRHMDTVPTMAEAVMMMNNGNGVYDENGLNKGLNEKVQYFLDRLYMSRISIHMLINQHMMLFGGDHSSSKRFIGSIDPHCNVVEVVEEAFANARMLCEQAYMCSPDLDITTRNVCAGEGDGIHITYVPSHLYHIFFELFKNALRATVEFYDHSDEELPDVKVMIVKSPCDLSIRISDQGGGIPRNDVDLLFQYSYSTAPRPSQDDDLGGNAPLAGLGYGLPLSKLYAKYFQGDLELNSLDGYGSDATVYLRSLASEARESLPVYNHASREMYKGNRSTLADWTDPCSTLIDTAGKYKTPNGNGNGNGKNGKNGKNGSDK